MTPRTRMTLTLALLCLAAAPAQAQQVEPTQMPFLWKIEGDTDSYIYGTIHVPDKRVTTLPEVVKEAVADCDELYGELEMNPALQMKAQTRMMLPQGKSLRDVIPAELYARVEKYVASKGIPIMVFARMKPWAVGSQLAMLDFIFELQMGAKPLDSLLQDMAKKAGKVVGGLETIDEQLNVFESFTEAEQVKQLDQALEGLEKALKEGVKATDELVEVYLAGEAKALEEKASEEWKVEDAMSKKLVKLLLTDRNVRMADRIEKKLKDNPKTSYFFAIGALHYPGEDGIKALLEAKGFKITRLTEADAGSLQKKKKPVGAGASQKF